MDCLYERDCQLFPELLDGSPQEEDPLSNPDHGGEGVAFNFVRQVPPASLEGNPLPPVY